jgi:DNA repair protein RecO (recombination protein O)
MPALGHCVVCGQDLRGARVWYSAAGDGVTCEDDCRVGSAALLAGSVEEARRMFQAPVAELAKEEWPRERAADLRRLAVGLLERHLERRLRSAVALGRG